MKKYLLSLILLFFSSEVFADKLKIAVGLWIPPYVIRDEARGIEYDILKETLALAGHEMVPRYVPLARTLAELRSGQVDGIMSTGLTDLPGCYTNTHITYWNYAITLSSNNIQIDSIKDLKGRTIMAFQNARNYLGEDYRQMTHGNKLYKEIGDQSSQNKLLFSKRVEVVIADQFIFQWFNRSPEVLKTIKKAPEVTYHEIFPPSRFQSVFLRQDVCDSFNIALKELKNSGRYDEIVASYGVTNVSDSLIN
ncbi:substrate-binding periplasmic protein [Kiloniella antarctica]|uniref:Substrate-binding periplasmic protein n=1 Tax=Kiloniella antarctica TaxID=1550907 RepID=A0ABW5BD09_9PROT